MVARTVSAISSPLARRAVPPCTISMPLSLHGRRGGLDARDLAHAPSDQVLPADHEASVGGACLRPVHDADLSLETDPRREERRRRHRGGVRRELEAATEDGGEDGNGGLRPA